MLWLATILGGLLLLALAWAIYLGYLSRQENRLRTACIERKEPLTLEEVASLYPPVGEKENAALALTELWSVDNPTFEDRFYRGSGGHFDIANGIPAELGRAADWLKREDISPEEWKILTEYLESFEARRPRLFAALKHPACRFPVQLGDGLAMLLPHVAMLRLEADRLTLDGLHAIRSHQVDRAVADIVGISSVGHLLGQEPLLITQLVSSSLCRRALDLSGRLLSSHPLSAGQLAELRQAFSWYSYEQALLLSIQSERATALNMYSLPPQELREMVDPDSNSDETIGYTVILRFAGLSGGKSADCINLLETFRAAEELVKNSSPPDHALWEKLFEKKPWRFPPQFFSQLCLPAVRGVIFRHLDTEVARRSLFTALAVESFREKNGKLPASLSELQAPAPDLIINDPYSTSQLRFKPLENGYTIYSVGRDGIDNDALAFGAKGVRYPTGDLPFTVTR